MLVQEGKVPVTWKKPANRNLSSGQFTGNGTRNFG
jgi:hypothetical protein